MVFFIFSLIVLCGIIFTIIKLADAENVSPVKIKAYQANLEKTKDLKKKNRVDFLLFLAPIILAFSLFSFLLDNTDVLDFRWQFYVFFGLFIIISLVGFLGFFFSKKYKIQRVSVTILFISVLTLAGVLFLSAESLKSISMTADFPVLMSLWLVGSMPAFYFTRGRETQILYNLVFSAWIILSIIFYDLSNILLFNLSTIALIQIWLIGNSFESANKKLFPNIQEINSSWFPILAGLVFLAKNYLIHFSNQFLENFLNYNYLYLFIAMGVLILLLMSLDYNLKKYFPKKYDINYFAAAVLLFLMPVLYFFADIQSLIIILFSSVFMIWILIDYYRHGYSSNKKLIPISFILIVAAIGFADDIFLSIFWAVSLFLPSGFLIFYKARMPRFYALILFGFVSFLVIEFLKASIDYRVILSILSVVGIIYAALEKKEDETLKIKT